MSSRVPGRNRQGDLKICSTPDPICQLVGSNGRLFSHQSDLSGTKQLPFGRIKHVDKRQRRTMLLGDQPSPIGYPTTYRGQIDSRYDVTHTFLIATKLAERK